MQYDRAFFDQGLNRKHTGCEKWDAEFMGEDTLALWVADMDFAGAEAIGKAMAERAMHPCFGYNSDEKEYTDAFCRFMQRRHQLDIEEEKFFAYAKEACTPNHEPLYDNRNLLVLLMSHTP